MSAFHDEPWTRLDEHMPLLIAIRHENLFDEPAEQEWNEEDSALRRAVRAVLLDDSGKMALMHAAKDRYHKLPGGGVEEGEDAETALRRELREETGAEIEIESAIGRTAEYIANYGLKQFSYAYSARLVGRPGETSFTDEEEAGGFGVSWIEPREALELMESERPQSYSGHFIRRRDLSILRAFLEGAASADGR
ncbi:NUDIX domain-containing protein [Saccharibacillus sp. CPCC 101409]|uniref:NUDIX domain-containing protein n=1 Tax=Saccharibacillus sp. CPCC 101409 TaxID=3058041 RepID=UPI002671E69F|nr:NUDIX domain-containing protein [Saccharibacillus sp. CPCC 101409]MDO3410467.1 NUDIX domain-containing protein [Saccharibacillus sp. CPCC 101409]